MNITITFTWGLICMIIFSLLILVLVIHQTFEHGDWSIITIIPLMLFLGLIWAVYGGVAWW